MSESEKAVTRGIGNNTRAQTSLYKVIFPAQYVNSMVYCELYESKIFLPKVGICMVDSPRSNMSLVELSDLQQLVE